MGIFRRFFQALDRLSAQVERLGDQFQSAGDALESRLQLEDTTVVSVTPAIESRDTRPIANGRHKTVKAR